MTLARHEPCQLLDGMLPQTMQSCWTQTIRLPYAGASVMGRLPEGRIRPGALMPIDYEAVSDCNRLALANGA